MAKRKQPGRGIVRHGANARRIVCSFDSRTFDDIRTAAVNDGVSFAEKQRQFVRLGLRISRELGRGVCR